MNKKVLLQSAILILILFINTDLSLGIISEPSLTDVVVTRDDNKLAISSNIEPSYNNLSIITLEPKLKNVDGSKIHFFLFDSHTGKEIISSHFDHGQFDSSSYYIFGFPPQENSNQKKFSVNIEFEDIPSSIEVKQENLIVVNKYKFNGNDLKSITGIWSYVKLKLQSSWIKTSLINKIGIFTLGLSPLILHLLIKVIKKLVDKKKNFLIFYIDDWLYISNFILAILVSTVLPKRIYNYSFTILFFWVLIIKFKKKDPSIHFFIAMTLFFMSVISLMSDLGKFINIFSEWTFYMLLIGSIHLLINNQKRIP